MIRKLPVTASEYLQVLGRRKWWAIAPLVLVPATAFIIGHKLPREYKSTTTIAVEPQKIPAEYVRSTVSGDVTDRLQLISEEIMSRTRLQQIMDDLHLYPQLQSKISRERIIDAMRKDINVEVITDPRPERHNVASFKVSYLAPSAEVAQQVTSEIANLFIQQNLKLRDDQARGTSQFIEDELLKAHATLELQEQKVKGFNSSHMGTLPEQAESNMGLLSQYQGLAQANSEAIDRAHQQQVYLQSMISANGTPTGAPIHLATPQETDLLQKRAALSLARQRYTDSHPDVKRLETEVATAEQQIHTRTPDAELQITPAAGPNMAQQLQSQLASTQQEITTRSARQRSIEAQVGSVQGRIATLPMVKSQFADMNRDYLAAQTNYQTLLLKQQDAQMSAALEEHNGGESFRVIDAPDLPSQPISPNLAIVYGAGILLGIMSSLLLAFFADLRDATIHDSTDLLRYLDIPLITQIPSISKIERLPFKQLVGNTN